MGHSYALNICNAVSIFLPVFSHCFPIFPIYNILAPRFITSPISLVLVAGFGARLPELPIIGGFDIDTYIDHARLDDVVLRRYAAQMHHLISDNDYVVAPANSRALAARLGGTVHALPRYGHFLSADGITELPAAWEALQSCFSGEDHV